MIENVNQIRITEICLHTMTRKLVFVSNFRNVLFSFWEHTQLVTNIFKNIKVLFCDILLYIYQRFMINKFNV